MKKHISNNFSNLRTIFIILIIFFIRNISLFFVFPIFSFYYLEIDGNSKFLSCLCLSIYGIFQIISQVPLYYFSLIIGKKNTVLISMLFFFIGNLICFLYCSIWGILIGRSFQGFNSSSILTDMLIINTSKENRVFSIFSIGIVFGLSFFLSMSFSIFVFKNIGLKNIFFISSILSLLLLFFSYFFIPKDSLKKNMKKKYFNKNNFFCFFKNSNNINFLKYIFISNFIFSSNFSVFSKIFSIFYIDKNIYYKIYFYIFFMSFFLSIIFIIFIRKKINNNNIYFYLFFLFFISQIIFFFNNNLKILLFLSMLIFFLVYNILSSILPILLRKNFNRSNLYDKNIITSIYTTFQIFGMSIGSIFSGTLCSFLNFKLVFLFCMFLIFLYFLTSKKGFLKKIKNN
ncbi:MFS transporter [Buchnera aphidicola (Pseudoregma panicola)]|uniref:MFS transporter n=1 Tax=Buchnera aphidicola TaxID=9 RepID=UPI0031B6724D